MVITVIAKVTEHEKVPAIEQHLSAGCAAQAMQWQQSHKASKVFGVQVNGCSIQRYTKHSA